jgi:hypothetical protein
MTSGSEGRGESAAWDRIGFMLEDMNALQNNVTKRTLDLWNQVAENLRRDGYGSDAMARDAARAMSTALDNMDDVWTFMTRPAQREFVAGVLPTAFLHVQWTGEEPSAPIAPEPVLIRAQGLKMEDLPPRAEIGVTGPDAGTAEAVRNCLAAVLVEGKPAYRLQTYDLGDLSPGTYGGLVYLKDTQQALANLRVVVDER